MYYVHVNMYIRSAAGVGLAMASGRAADRGHGLLIFDLFEENPWFVDWLGLYFLNFRFPFWF